MGSLLSSSMSVADSKRVNVFDKTDFKKSKDNFHWVDTEEIHAVRRRKILAVHPEIRNLFQVEHRTFLIVLLITAIQLSTAYWIRDKPWWLFAIVGYCVGGTLNHSLQLASHELSHNLGFATGYYNKMAAICANLVTGVPSAITFGRYHMEHHQYQGVDGIDTDIPVLAEIKVFHNTVFKICFLFLQPLFYALRPIFVNPKKQNKWEIGNMVAVFGFDFLIYSTLGGWALLYMVYGTLIGLGLHPAAGHFIAEHYEFVYDYETYSYYGPWNFFNFNVGYHNEHHDFPRIPWSRLPEVRKLAPEFYNDLPCYTSYLKVMYNYVTDSEIGPFSRVKRHRVSGKKK